MSREEIPLGSFLWVIELLYRYATFVCNRLKLVIFSPICTLKLHGSYRTHYIEYDAAIEDTSELAINDFLKLSDEADYLICEDADLEIIRDMEKNKFFIYVL